MKMSRATRGEPQQEGLLTVAKRDDGPADVVLVHELECAGAGHFSGHVAGHDGDPVVAEDDAAVDQVAREVLVSVVHQVGQLGDGLALQQLGRADEDDVVAVGAAGCERKSGSE